MEFLRGYISNCIDFYFLLSMPQYDTFSDAILVWSNRFQVRSHKNIEIMFANLIKYRSLSDDKEGSKRAIADYIRRLVGKLHILCKDMGQDETYCPKGILKIEFNPDDIDDSLRSFQLKLKNNNAYADCRIDYFVKQKREEFFKKISVRFVEDENGNKRKGFDKLVCDLEKISIEKNITCAYCSKIGDAVIAVLSLNLDGCTLEHTDYAFNYLCPILKQGHRLHSNEVKILDEVA